MSDSPIDLIHRSEQRVAALFLEEAGNLDITARQIAVLRAIEKLPGASQAAIVAATGVDRSTLADVLVRLAKRGLVKKKRSKADQRAFEVVLTAEGSGLLKRAGGIAKRVEQRLLEAVPGGRRASFLKDLEAIGRMVEAKKLAAE